MDDIDFTDLTLVQQGSAQALANLYERHSKIVYSVALRTLHNPASAEDILQEVFLQIWRTPERFLAATGNLCAWLSVISRNRSIDELRKRRPSEPVDELTLASPWNFADHAELSLLCERALQVSSQLPLEQRTAIEMAFFDGMTHTEISTLTGCPLGTIKTRIRSALSVMRQGLTTKALAV